MPDPPQMPAGRPATSLPTARTEAPPAFPYTLR